MDDKSLMTIAGSYFEKVPFEEFESACRKLEQSGDISFGGEDGAIRRIYDAIELPRRATAGSAGYDFHMPFPAVFTPDKSVLIPTGIRVVLPRMTYLMCVPRSGLGFKYGMALRNSTGIIDSDYANSDNYGHIMARITTEEPFRLDTGDRFMQGIISLYFITDEDSPISDDRNGGFGSTGGAS